MEIKKLESIIDAAIQSAAGQRIVDAGDGIQIVIKHDGKNAYHFDTIFPDAPHGDLCFCGDCPAIRSCRSRKISAGWARIGRKYIASGYAQRLIAIRHEQHCIVLTFTASQIKVKKHTKLTEVL